MSRTAANFLSVSLTFLLCGLGSPATARADVIKASLVPSRIDGMAPLPVFFDATATQLGSGSLHNGRFFWDFGDSSPHPTASGFAVGHVFEQPGEYEVKLTIADATGPQVATTVKITVNPFVGATYYVSSSTGNDTNNGLSERAPFKTFDHAMGKLESILTGGPAALRILFQRGDTFTTDGIILTKCHGRPAILSAYGTGNRPVIQVSPKEEDVINFLSDNSGFRFVDLELRGNYNFSARSGPGQTLIAMYDKHRDFLLLRVHAEHCGDGFAMGGGKELSEIFVVDSTFYEVEDQGLYVGASQLALIGNEINKSAYTHLLRVWHADKAFISRNVLLYPSFGTERGRLALKLHADGAPTRYVVVSENRFKGSTYTVAIAPQNTGTVEYVDDVVFENNVVESDSLSRVGVYIIANDVTVRNNLFVRDASTKVDEYAPIRIDEHEILPDSKRIRIYNNTACDFRGSYDAHFLEIFAPTSSAIDVKNNLFFAPDAVGNSVGIWFKNPLSGFTADYNLLYVPKSDGRSIAYQATGSVDYPLAAWQKAGKGLHSLIDDPNLADPGHGNYRPGPASKAIDAGTVLPGVFEAIDGEPRPLGTGLDLGAYEFVSPGTSGRFGLDAVPANPAPGATVNFNLSAVGYGGKAYQVGLAFASHPAIRIEQGSIPLCADALYYFSVMFFNGYGFENFAGMVPASGAVTAKVHLPASAVLHGLTFHAASVIWDGPRIGAISNPVFVLVQ